MSKRFFLLALLTIGALHVNAQRLFSVSGTVAELTNGTPIDYATVAVDEHMFTMTDSKGRFHINNIPEGNIAIKVQCLGYNEKTIQLSLHGNMEKIAVRLEPATLQLKEVSVTAQRKSEDATSSYIIDRLTMDNQQIVNLSDISTLLPGGKTINSTLMNDERLALHSSNSEKGNAAFGTAIELDGVRLQNNAMPGETLSASTRNLSSTNIESVEVITGIPSVEYGDLSNGMVKVHTRRGKTPLTVELAMNPYTRQIAAAKGFSLAKGILNASVEHTRSISDQASPHTAYQRNTMSLLYRRTFMPGNTPLYLTAGLNGNIGGQNSKSDPDAFTQVYAKSRDYSVGTHINLNWQLNRSWLSNIEMTASLQYQDKKSSRNTNQSSSSAQPYIHTTEEGYFIAASYDENPNAPIILSPTGYWYVKSFTDSKPVAYSLRLKANWFHNLFSQANNRIKLGAEWTGNGNEGRGRYYADMKVAPTWREYRYDNLPYLNNYSLYAEDKLHIPTGESASLLFTAGIRADISSIRESEYGTVGSLSPRFNAKYTLFEHRNGFFRSAAIYSGWGKSVKLPSFEVLYPSPSYADRLSFAPGTTADGKTFYAYHTTPFKALHNSNLKWQYAHQWEIGADIETKVAKINLSFYNNKTFRPYIATAVYSPISYNLTDQAALNNIGIASGDRYYTVDQTTGVVTVGDKTGQKPSVQLPYSTRNTYHANLQYRNGSPVRRTGIDWVVDFRQIPSLHTALRIDGSYYHYKGVERQLIASLPDAAQQMANGEPYKYIGYYEGSSVYGSGNIAYATTANGNISERVNTNLTVTTHIPRLRLVVSLRIETTLYDYRRALSKNNLTQRAYALESMEDYFGTPYDGHTRDQYVAVYPAYYSTWEDPETLLPFEETLRWAQANDQQLFNELTKLIVKTTYSNTFNPDSISAFWSANMNITKEIGSHVTVSFLANNFLNSMGKVKSSRSGQYTSLYNSSYIPSFYYGMSVKLKF